LFIEIKIRKGVHIQKIVGNGIPGFNDLGVFQGYLNQLESVVKLIFWIIKGIHVVCIIKNN